MPGTDTMGDYTVAEIQAMSPADLIAAQQNGFRKPLVAAPGAGPIEAAREAAGINLGSSVPAAVTQPQGDGNVWARRRKGDRDFTCPSGQKCRLKPLDIEQLMMEGVLDQVTRLEGLAQELINRAEGLPPEKQTMPSREDFGQLLNLVNVIVPMAVADPPLYADDDKDAPDDGIRVSDVDLMDRIAILNEALSGLKKLDNFRPAG